MRWRRLPMWACLGVFVACGDSEPVGTQGAGDVAVGFAVVCSDYVSSQVALMQPDGLSVAAGALIHSGSQDPGLVLSMSGDVVLPTVHTSGPQSLLIDRTHGVLTWVERASAAVLRQLPVAEGFAANPHDAVEMADGTVLVTRYGREPGQGARGDDIAVFGPDGYLQQRLPFDAAEGVAARPDRMAPFEGAVLVTLNHGATDYSEWGAGRYARLASSAAGWSVERDWTLEGVRNCGGLAVDGGSAAIVCTGGFVQGAPQGEGSGALVTDPHGDEVARLLASDARVGGPLGSAIGAHEGVVWLVRLGSVGGQGDTILRWEPGEDRVEVVLDLESAFVTNSLAPIPSGGLLVPVGVAEDPRLCRLDATGWSCSAVCTQSGLPPRSLLWVDEPG